MPIVELEKQAVAGGLRTVAVAGGVRTIAVAVSAALAFAVMASTSAWAQQAPGAVQPAGTGAGASPAASPSPSRTSEMAAPSEAPQSGVPDADQDFLNQAVRRGLTEVTLGGVAKERAASDQVKKFGERMVADHHDANEALMRVATAKGIALPTELDKNEQKSIDDLAALSGPDFDRAYVKRMVTDHRSDVSAFQKEAQSGEDPEIKAVAQKILPVLKEHLKMAESMQAASNPKPGAR